jgi:hypothetical protein
MLLGVTHNWGLTDGMLAEFKAAHEFQPVPTADPADEVLQLQQQVAIFASMRKIWTELQLGLDALLRAAGWDPARAAVHAAVAAAHEPMLTDIPHLRDPQLNALAICLRAAQAECRHVQTVLPASDARQDVFVVCIVEQPDGSITKLVRTPSGYYVISFRRPDVWETSTTAGLDRTDPRRLYVHEIRRANPDGQSTSEPILPAEDGVDPSRDDQVVARIAAIVGNHVPVGAGSE